jgi:hypothetical protein
VTPHTTKRTLTAVNTTNTNTRARLCNSCYDHWVTEAGGWRCKECASSNANPHALVRTPPNTTKPPAECIAVASWQSADDVYDDALI